MLVLAYRLMNNCPDSYLKQVMDIFSQTALEICEGQQWDMEFETRNDVTVPEYMEMIRLKTSVLLSAALKIGAVLGGLRKIMPANYTISVSKWDWHSSYRMIIWMMRISIRMICQFLVMIFRKMTHWIKIQSNSIYVSGDKKTGYQCGGQFFCYIGQDW